MKKLFLRAILPILIFLYLFFAYFSSPLLVSAQIATPSAGTYACVLSDTAYFYLSPSGKDGIFLLPKTYYVHLLSYSDTYCKVEYLQTDIYTQKLTGYVRTDQLAFVEYIPRRPYLTYVFDLTYRLENATPNTSDAFTQLTVSCAYYGDFPIGDQTWCYVLREGVFGYVPKPDYLSYEPNTEYADYLATQQPVTPDEQSKSSPSSPAQIATLITLCLLVPLLAALILKSPRKPPYETDD